MKRIALIMTVALVACVGLAKPKAKIISAATGTNTTATAADTSIVGWIDEIVLEAPTGVTSGIVAVVATQPIGNTVTLASKTVTVDVLVRPGLDFTDTAGSALTSDPPRRYYSYGDSIALTVTAADPTGLTWRVWIKYDDGK
ncbi:MAG: hypothetical protein ABIH03_09335 [Pseudomonadota bacterium]